MSVRLCFHCDEPTPATRRVTYDPGPGVYDRRVRASFVCGQHLQDELDELIHLGFEPKVG